jgi:hypothetical protein
MVSCLRVYTKYGQTLAVIKLWTSMLDIHLSMQRWFQGKLSDIGLINSLLSLEINRKGKFRSMASGSHVVTIPIDTVYTCT